MPPKQAPQPAGPPGLTPQKSHVEEALLRQIEKGSEIQDLKRTPPDVRPTSRSARASGRGSGRPIY